MLLSLDLESDTPLYTQLRNEIIRGIVDKKLKEGDSLPSVRQLAGDLSVNMHTINKAYNILKQEGFLTVHRRQGVVVNSPEKYKANEEYKMNLIESIKPYSIEAKCRGLGKEEIIKFIENIYLGKEV